MENLICFIVLLLRIFSDQSYSMNPQKELPKKVCFDDLCEEIQGIILEKSVNNPSELVNFFDFSLKEQKIFSLNQIKMAILVAHHEGKTFDLSQQSFSSDQFQCLFTGCGLLSKIKKLKLTRARLDDVLLTDLPSSLEVLDLAHAHLRTQGLQELSHLTRLVSLDLSGNFITEVGATLIAEMQGVVTLNLSGNIIKDGGVAKISKMVGIRNLNLSDNQVGPVGAAKVAEMSKIVTLSLSYNRIGLEGARSVAKMMSYNGIGPEGAMEIAEMQGMTTLNLSYNGIGLKGVEKIT